jgi:hypothetical protein
MTVSNYYMKIYKVSSERATIKGLMHTLIASLHLFVCIVYYMAMKVKQVTTEIIVELIIVGQVHYQYIHVID